MSSNFEFYGAIDNGEYIAYCVKREGPLGTHFSINNGAPVNCLNGSNPSKINPYSKTQKNSIWIHRSNRNGDMLPSKDGKYYPLSTGCLIIAPTIYDSKGNIIRQGWDQFTKQLETLKSFKVILKRE